MYRFGWFGIDFNSSYQARFYGIPLDFIGYKRTIQRFLGQTVSVSNFNLSDSVLENMLENFVTEKFDYINGYTSSIVLFVKYLHNLILKLFVLP
jgi:phenylacetate-CoA ligase